MQAAVTWSHSLSFEGVADSGSKVKLSGDAAVGGEGEGFRPMELVLVGLVGCTGMDVISILQRMRQDVTAFQVSAEAEKAAKHPKVFTQIHIHYAITGRQVTKDSVERAIELSKVRYCPVQAMLDKGATITHSYTLQEAESV